jgi:lysophospholipase L1-like esterase
MKRKILVALVAMSAVLAGVPSPASAAPVREVYISVGTSLAAGTMADAQGNNILFTDQSYTDMLAEDLSSSEHVKLGCPGETVETFVNGGICYPGNGVTQLSLAQARLAQGDVDLLTIDLGANDFLNAQGEILACGEDLVCVFAILSGIAADVGGVIDALQAVDPDVQIVAMNYYNPNLAALIGYFPGVPGQQAPDPTLAVTSNIVSTIGNGLLEAQFAARGVLVADVQREFSGEDFGDDDGDFVPNNVEVLCKWTYMCPSSPTAAPNIHANDDGYDRISDAFERVIADSE